MYEDKYGFLGIAEKAADAVIRYLKAAGYQLVTVSELAAYRGGMAAGKVYTRF